MAYRTEAANGDGYKINIGVFHGPLDLLLYLIQKEEVDIYDIPIAKITGEYLKYIDLMTSLNLEVAGEFILMAATLIRIKTRMLLPRDEGDAAESDPREELIMALIEYKKYKEAGEVLREKALLEERHLVPPSPVNGTRAVVDLLPDTSLFDLLTAFRDVLASRRDESFHQVTAEEVSIVDRMHYIMSRLEQQECSSFRDLFADAPVKIVAVMTFIALLELVRTRRVVLRQSRPFAELRVYRGELFSVGPTDFESAADRQREEEVTV